MALKEVKVISNKLVHRLQSPPASYEELVTSVSSFQNNSHVSLKFKDSFGVLKPMRTDADYREALQSDSVNFFLSSDEEILSVPSEDILDLEEARLAALEEQCIDSEKQEPLYRSIIEPAKAPVSLPNPSTVHHGVSCDNCFQYPIVGTRYKCATCPNFDFCQTCWEGNQHEHPFYAIKDPFDFSHAEIVLTDPSKFAEVRKAAENVLKPKKLKLEYVSDGQIPEQATLYVGTDVRKSWFVQNVGSTAWSAGCVLEVVYGVLELKAAVLPCLTPQEKREVAVHFTVPSSEGLHSFAFRAVTPDGQYFGEKLHMTILISSLP